MGRKWFGWVLVIIPLVILATPLALLAWHRHVVAAPYQDTYFVVFHVERMVLAAIGLLGLIGLGLFILVRSK